LINLLGAVSRWDDKEYIAVCHSIGQACAAVHTAGHANGYLIYDLTSLVYQCGAAECAEKIESRKRRLINYRRKSYVEMCKVRVQF